MPTKRKPRTVTLYTVRDDDAIEHVVLHDSFSEACQHARNVASVGEETEVARVTYQVPSGKGFKNFLCNLHNRTAVGEAAVIRRYIPTHVTEEDNEPFGKSKWAFKVEKGEGTDAR